MRRNGKKLYRMFIVTGLSLVLLTACSRPKTETNSSTANGSVRENTDSRNSSDRITNSQKDPQRKMVQLNGRVYISFGYVNSAITCGTADGQITSTVGANEAPTKDNCSNFGIGYDYQMMADPYVSVKIDDRWIIFQDMAISYQPMPEAVASFTATVTEASKEGLLVTVSQVDQKFAWIFDRKEADQIKPIWLPAGDLETADQSLLATGKLTGRSVRVWFDGKLKDNEAESSLPTKLGEIYQIEVGKE